MGYDGRREAIIATILAYSLTGDKICGSTNSA